MFEQKLSQRIANINSNLCVGLDPRGDLTKEGLVDFITKVIEETFDYAAAYKPNIAYFEAFGSDGYAALEKLLTIIPNEVPVILDCKRSDIGETQRYYAQAYFEHMNVDAVTLNPWLGFDSLLPFLSYREKGIYLLAITSNPGAEELALRQVDGRYFFEFISDMCGQSREYQTSVGLVLGLTNLTGKLITRIPDVPLLFPGFGAQGGELFNMNREKRRAPLLVNVSRGILYNQPDKSFAEKARGYAKQIQQVLKAKP